MTRQEAYEEICSKAYHEADIPLRDYMDLYDFENVTDFDEIEVDRIIDEHSEVVYYSRALVFLEKHDPSLQESLAIASEYGYEVKDLSSEVLASLLNGQMMREYWYGMRDEIQNILDDIEEDEEDY